MMDENLPSKVYLNVKYSQMKENDWIFFIIHNLLCLESISKFEQTYFVLLCQLEMSFFSFFSIKTAFSLGFCQYILTNLKYLNILCSFNH